MICLISFNSIVEASIRRRHHKKARKWAEKDTCVCSSSVCDPAKFALFDGRDNGTGDSNNCACPKAK